MRGIEDREVGEIKGGGYGEIIRLGDVRGDELRGSEGE